MDNKPPADEEVIIAEIYPKNRIISSRVGENSRFRNFSYLQITCISSLLHMLMSALEVYKAFK